MTEWNPVWDEYGQGYGGMQPPARANETVASLPGSELVAQLHAADLAAVGVYELLDEDVTQLSRADAAALRKELGNLLWTAGKISERIDGLEVQE